MSGALPFTPQALSAGKRKSETDIIRELERDMPKIFRGLLDLTAKILAELPNAVVEHPQRMLDFVRWLAAMECALGFPGPVLQAQYAAALKEAQCDSLLENLLGSAMVEFAATLNDEWTGPSSKLLAELNNRADYGTASAREWPRNPIALSKRLRGLQASLRSQGIMVEVGGRGKERRVTVRVEGAGHE